MSEHDVASSSADRAARDALNLKFGGVCAIAGAVIFAAFRLNHGDTPAADAGAALDFVAARPSYAAVHVFAVFGALVGLAGLISLASSLTRQLAWLIARAGVASAAVGLAVFSVESTSEGLGLPELADAAAGATPDERAELVRAAQALAAATHGPSLIGMALLIGVPLTLFGLAIALDTYPTWLGWTGTVIGAAVLISAVGLFLSPTLIPGALLYGVLASLLAQLWLAAVGIVLLHRARRHSYR